MVQSRLILCSTINFAQTTRLVPAQYSSIQSAIDASVSNDIILVAPGTYNENIDFGNKTLILKGSSSPDSTFLNGNGVDGIVILNGAGGIIQNFSIYNCPIGIRSESASKIFIVNCKIYDNNIYGIHNFGLGEVKIINSLFHHNGVGFFQNYYGVESYIQNSTFSDNTTDIDFQPGYGTTVGLHIFNSIIRGQVQGTADNKVTLNYCNYDPSKLGTNVDIGEGCQTANPLFKNASSGNYRLSLSSPCIDAGTIDTTGLNIPQTDLDNKIRIWQGIIDIGSYEYGSITPTVVVLQSPLNYSVGLVSPIELKWLPSNFTVSYRLQVSTDKSFTSLIVDSNSMVNTSYTLVEQTYLKTYYWRVRANFVGGLSEWSDVWNFKTLGEPTIVKPLLPLTNSINLPIELDFVWNRAIDKFKATKGNGIQAISNYWFELSSNISDVSYLIDSLLTDTTKHVSGLANLTDYYWRVRAKNQTGWGSYSNWSKFTTIIDTPEVVVLKSPFNNSVGNIQPIEVTWNSSLRAESYHVQIYIDANFDSFVVDSSSIIDTSYLLPKLNNLTNYFWRIRSSNYVGASGWSETWNFRTVGEPNAVTQVSPLDNSINQSIGLNFVWNKAKDKLKTIKGNGIKSISNYWFELSTNISNSSYLIDSLLTDTTKHVSGLANLTDYYWRVRAKNQTGWGSYSNWSKFTTIINSPSVVTLVSPTNNSERIIKPVKLSWIKSSFAESFTLQLSIDVNFTTAVLDSSGIIDSNLVFVNLSDLTNYYWRVKASNAGGESDWSEVWRFATLGTPTSPILISPENNIELPDTTTNVKFAWSSVNAADSYSFEASNSQSFDSLLVSTDLSDTSYTYSNGLIAGTFFWRVNAKNQAGIGEYSETFAINIVLTDVDGRGNQIPQEYVLSQNYPNPFNPSTMIKYGLPEQSNVKIEIFNILGQSIGVLVNQDKSSGYYETTWNAENLPSGIYLICIKAIGLSYKKNFTQVRKALLLK